jgi:hypothetical protein
MKFCFGIIFITLIGCKTLKTPVSTIVEEPLELIGIKAINLSEDGTIISTKNDEILVSILFGSFISEDKWFMNGYSLPLLIFDSSRMEYSRIKDATLGADFACPTCEVWICLTEMDDEGTAFDTNEKLIDYINAKGYKALESKAAVDAVLKDNDFLGFARIPYNQPKIPSVYTIKGNDLLDKYEYQLTISTEKWDTKGTKKE